MDFALNGRGPDLERTEAPGGSGAPERTATGTESVTRGGARSGPSTPGLGTWRPRPAETQVSRVGGQEFRNLEAGVSVRLVARPRSALQPRVPRLSEVRALRPRWLGPGFPGFSARLFAAAGQEPGAVARNPGETPAGPLSLNSRFSDSAGPFLTPANPREGPAYLLRHPGA